MALMRSKRFFTVVFAALALITALASAAAEERWYSGTIAGQQAVSLRQIEQPQADGSLVTISEMLIALRRQLPGRGEVRIDIREHQRLVEDRDGWLTAWRFDRDEQGAVTTAEGLVRSSDASVEVEGMLSRAGRTVPMRISASVERRPRGEHWQQRQLATQNVPVGYQSSVMSLSLVGGAVRLSETDATRLDDAVGQRRYRLVPELAPLPIELTIDAEGHLQRMSLALGAIAVELVPASGPVALLGAELPPTGLVRQEGMAPGLRGPTRYRLPSVEPLPANPFQRQQGDVLRVDDEPAAMVPDEDERHLLLQATPQLEIDEPELRTWALAAAGDDGTAAERAERLRLAVRSHITGKDLSRAESSALETFRNRVGDCTEHATLLCAALRIAGISAAIECGFVYVPDYGGWVGHAWNRAWAGGKWIHLDSAYPGIPRSRYLCLATADAAGLHGALLVQLNRFVGGSLSVLP